MVTILTLFLSLGIFSSSDSATSEMINGPQTHIVGTDLAGM